LRHLLNEHQDSWADHFGEIQFAMNNSPNASTGKAPSELLMAFTPRSAINIATTQVQRGQGTEAIKCADSLRRLREEAQDAIQLAEFSMAATYDKGHKITDLRVGDKVFINIPKRTKAGYSVPGIKSPKLSPQRVGPFLITEMCTPNAYRVDIPSDWKIWPVISVRHWVKAPRLLPTHMNVKSESLAPPYRSNRRTT
jgi:hypothetical protein